jgi:hypothetical protein
MTGQYFPKSGRQDLNLRPLDPQSGPRHHNATVSHGHNLNCDQATKSQFVRKRRKPLFQGMDYAPIRTQYAQASNPPCSRLRRCTPTPARRSWPSSRPLRGGNRQIRPTHVSIFNRLLDQFRHGLVAVNHVMRAAGKIGDSGLVRIDAHVVIEGRVHFTKMHGPIGNRGA